MLIDAVGRATGHKRPDIPGERDGGLLHQQSLRATASDRGGVRAVRARALHTVQMGENEFCLVAIYESKSAADHALEHAKQIWGQFGNVIDLKTMKIDKEDVVWNYGAIQRADDSKIDILRWRWRQSWSAVNAPSSTRSARGRS